MLSHVWLFVTLWTVAHQAPLSMGFSRQEYWSGLPFPSPGDPPDPRIKPVSLASPASSGGFFTTVPAGKLLSTEDTNVRKIILVYFFFFWMQAIFKNLFWICYNIASVLCFGFLASRHVRSILATQPGIESTPLHRPQYLNHWISRKVPLVFILSVNILPH